MDKPFEDMIQSGLRGVSYKPSDVSRSPASLVNLLGTDGIESVFIVNQEKVVTLNKKPSAKWEAVLPPAIEALGGGSSLLSLDEMAGLLSIGGNDDTAPSLGGVTIRLQVSQKLPIQVEASGWSGRVPPMRAKLSARFGSAMGMLMERPGDAFFKGRAWLDRGLRYSDALDGGEEAEDEERAVASALAAELAEVEAAYPDERLAALIFGEKAIERPKEPSATSGDQAISLEELERLCDVDAEYEAREEMGLNDALRTLAALVSQTKGAVATRRFSIAYLGGTAGRGGDAVFDAVVHAFKSEKLAGLRRTAGDALSDLGDARAAPIAAAALNDRSPLVRWRAARIVGELGEDAAVCAALRQAAMEEGAFEVAFEMKDALRKVERRLRGEEEVGGSGPMWRQLQERPR